MPRLEGDMMRRLVLLLPAMALTACQPAVPNSGGGVGFGDYTGYLAQREAALQGQRTAPDAPFLAATGYRSVGRSSPQTGAPQIATPQTATPQTGAPDTGAVALTSLGATLPPRSGTGADLGAPLNAMGLDSAATASGPSAVAQANATPLPRTASGAVMSDENNFDAVAARETIASDKARIAANRAAYQQVQPGALPARSGDTGPNLAAYALQASNRLGEPVWQRGGLSLVNHNRACAKFASVDQAQIAFLTKGGPQRDPGNLDPDGDGFACFWDPTPFQAVRQ